MTGVQSCALPIFWCVGWRRELQCGHADADLHGRWCDERKLLAHQLFAGQCQEVFSRRIDNRDDAIVLDADDGGRDARENRFDKASAVVDLGYDRDEREGRRIDEAKSSSTVVALTV